MRNLIVVLVLLCACLPGPELSAQQLSKAELKGLKAELKKYKKNPLLYKLKIQKLEKLAKARSVEVDDLEALVRKKDRVIREMEDSLAGMNRRMTYLQEEMEARQAPDSATHGEAEAVVPRVARMTPPSGTAFKVQVGSYMKFDITDYFQGPKYFDYEVIDGNYTYNIGFFNTMEDARRFAEDVKRMGIKDAFVRRYTNP